MYATIFLDENIAFCGKGICRDTSKNSIDRMDWGYSYRREQSVYLFCMP